MVGSASRTRAGRPAPRVLGLVRPSLLAPLPARTTARLGRSTLIRVPPVLVVVAAIAVVGLGAGCCFVRDFTPPPEPVYAPIWQPKLTLHEKADRFETSFRAHNRTPEGLVEYERPKAGRTVEEPRYGWFSDGPFHTGISLATFSLKYAATRDRAALADVSKALEGLE